MNNFFNLLGFANISGNCLADLRKTGKTCIMYYGFNFQKSC